MKTQAPINQPLVPTRGYRHKMRCF